MNPTDHESGLTPEELREIIDYNAETGIFTWKNCPGNNTHHRNGKVAGYPRGKARYIVITIYKRNYVASRLAWLYMTGVWPAHNVDHVDLDPSNNKWGNLRAATYSQNNANRRSPKRITGLPRGVSRGTIPNLKKAYEARIKVNKKSIYLGMFETPGAAHEAYLKAQKKYFGEYGRSK